MLDKAIFDDDFLSRHNLEGMNINSEKFGWMLQAKDHISCEGVHPQGWSPDWRAWIKRKEDAGTKITPGMIRGKLAHMMGKYGLLMKGKPADVPYHIWQLGKEARVAYKAARAAGEAAAHRAAKKAAKEAAEATAKRARRGAKAIPVIGVAIAVGFFAEDVNARGIIPGTINTCLDSTPYLGTAKMGSEIASGKDWIPDKKTVEAQERFWRRYNETIDFYRTIEEEQKLEKDPWGWGW